MCKSATRIMCVLLPLFLAIGCGGGSGSSGPPPTQPPPPPVEFSLSGAGVKGPLAGAQLTVYAVDGAVADWKGSEIDTGSTDSAAAIVDVQIPDSVNGLLLLEFTADSNTVDITTGTAPVITVMRTVIDASRVRNAELIYASPLTELAVAIAIANADGSTPFNGNGDGTSSADEIADALTVAGRQVTSTFGFSLLDDIDIFLTPPLLTSTTDEAAEQSAVAAYRTAIEGATALIQAITDESLATNPSSGLDNDAVLAALASDLGDGAIDGVENGVAISVLSDVADLANVLTQNPMALTIPGTTTLIGDIEAVLVDETGTTGTTVDTAGLGDGSVSVDPQPVVTSPDSDGDTVRDDTDNCVGAPNADQLDTDGDTDGDACDLDDDNDQVADVNDAFPLDPLESVDTDGDGVGNNADTDDDGDNVSDNDDAFPLDPTETTDTDQDGTGDNADTDDDADGVNDDTDNCPKVPNTDQADADQDGVGDACAASAEWDNFNWDGANWQ